MKNAAFAGLCTGVGTLFRPEAPLLLVACLPVVLWLLFAKVNLPAGCALRRWRWLQCFSFCFPWTARNAITLHEFQPLTPKYTTMPGELAPVGFMAWESTWLYRFREVFLVPWKLNDEAIQLDDIPHAPSILRKERQHVAAILEQYTPT